MGSLLLYVKKPCEIYFLITHTIYKVLKISFRYRKTMIKDLCMHFNYLRKFCGLYLTVLMGVMSCKTDSNVFNNFIIENNSIQIYFALHLVLLQTTVNYNNLFIRSFHALSTCWYVYSTAHNEQKTTFEASTYFFTGSWARSLDNACSSVKLLRTFSLLMASVSGTIVVHTFLGKKVVNFTNEVVF